MAYPPLHRLALAAALGAGIPPAAADGVWFDIGADSGSYVYESSGGASWEYFPPHPFGPAWPVGTVVYAELTRIQCAALPDGCDARNVVAAYVATFDGASCGCGGVLYGTCRLRLHYDAGLAAALGANETTLVLGHLSEEWGTPRWVAVDGAVVDATADFVEADVAGSISGSQFYGIFLSLPSPPAFQESTWSRVKLLWR
jgi:hypothetical protein